MKRIKIISIVILVILIFCCFSISSSAAGLCFYLNGNAIELDKGYTWNEYCMSLGERPLFYTDFEYVYYNGYVLTKSGTPVSWDDEIVPGGSYSTGTQHNHTWNFDENFVNSHYKCETFTYERWCNGCGLYNTVQRDALIQHNKAKINTIITPATCITPGTAYYSCDCGYLFEDQLDEYADEYAHSYSAKTYSATCYSYPYSIKTCVYCGDTIKTIFGDMLNHNYVLKNSTSSTCTTAGYKLYECNVCGLTKEVNTNALGHKIEWGECKRSGCNYNELDETGKVISSFFDNTWTGFSTGVTNIWNDISGGASKLWNDAGKEINKFTTSAGNWFSGLGKGIEEDFNAFIETITGNKKENSDEPNFWDEIARILTLIAVIAAIVFLCFIVPPIVKYFTSKGSQDKQPKPQNKVNYNTNNYRYNYRNNYRHY